MQGLTLQREWAWLVAAGHKRVENRRWSTAYRGRLAIHAGLKSDPAARMFCEEIGVALPDHLPGGVIVAVADLVDVVAWDSLFAAELRRDPFACGPFCFVLNRVRKLREPVVYRGRLGLFPVPDELLAELC